MSSDNEDASPLHKTVYQVEEEPRYPGSDVENDELMCLEGPLSEEDETIVAPKPTKGVEKKKRKKPGFRMHAKQFILTFPQCDVKKEVAVERIEQKWKSELKGYIVCEEEHKDGTPHLHVFLLFDKRKNFVSVNCFDFIGGKHGNYQVAKSVRGSVTYVTKAGNYIAKGLDVDAIIKKKAQKSDEVAKMLMDGKTLAEINKEMPGYVMINKKKLEDYETWIKSEKAKGNKKEWVPPSAEGLTGSQKVIVEWICKYVKQPMPFKAPQLYIWGKKNLGKTSLVRWLKQYLSVYHIPTTEEFYDLYSDQYDLVVLDEFKGQKTIQWLNEFLQGEDMPIRKKGSQAMKCKNIPTIILSNYPLHEVYVKAAQDGRLETLEARLEIVEVEEFIDFYLKQ